ncbi:hypothetical protein CPC08DRAFT_716896 [Agrocybe pediades]|nr:hypothetical protein CPC08DRAFT_716896 [Agrocybe pediades]
MQASILRHSFTRQAFGQQRSLASKRLMSSSTEATQKKAQDALAAAQKNAGKFLDGAKKFLEPLGDKEVFKQIYVKEGLQPPTLDAFKSAYSPLWSQISNSGLVGNLAKSGEFGRVGVYGLQAYGIFKIGEIIGRRHFVGYKPD